MNCEKQESRTFLCNLHFFDLTNHHNKHNQTLFILKIQSTFYCLIDTKKFQQKKTRIDFILKLNALKRSFKFLKLLTL